MAHEHVGLVYLCTSCGAVGEADWPSNQRDPGPFPPSGWDTLRRRDDVHVRVCPDCIQRLLEVHQNGRSEP